MAKLSKEQRDKLPESDFGWPENRLYPIVDTSDVANAASLIGKAPEAEQEKIKARVKAICQRKSLKLPDAWQGKGAEMSNPLVADFAAATGVEQNGHVLRACPVIFRCGDYAFPPTTDKPDGWTFTMTPEDIMAVIADAKEPVEIDDAHRPEVRPDGTPAPQSFFKGKLGTITNLRPLGPNDYSGFAGDWLCPKAINALSPDKPVHLSATFDPVTRRLKKVSLTDHPRIPDAGALPAGTVELSPEAVFAAVAEEEAKRATPTGVGTGAAFAQHSPHGLAAMQMHHDLAAKSGALCSAAKPGEMAGFTLPVERDAQQSIHDAACKAGALCKLIDDASPQAKRITDTRDAYYAEFAAAHRTPEERAMIQENLRLKAELEAERNGKAEATFAVSLKAAKDRADAAAKSMITGKRAVRADFAVLRDEYLQACLDDLRHPGEVQFSLDGANYQTGSREQAVKARWSKKPELKIYGEHVGPDPTDTDALFSVRDRETPDPTKPKEENVQAALRGAGPAGAAAIKEREQRNGRK